MNTYRCIRCDFEWKSDHLEHICQRCGFDDTVFNQIVNTNGYLRGEPKSLQRRELDKFLALPEDEQRRIFDELYGPPTPATEGRDGE